MEFRKGPYAIKIYNNAFKWLDDYLKTLKDEGAFQLYQYRKFLTSIPQL